MRAGKRRNFANIIKDLQNTGCGKILRTSSISICNLSFQKGSTCRLAAAGQCSLIRILVSEFLTQGTTGNSLQVRAITVACGQV